MEVQSYNNNDLQKPADLASVDLNSYGANWVWRAIESLVTAKNFDPSVTAIANRLNVSIEAVVSALEGLERMGLIVRSGRTFIKPDGVTILNQATHSKTDLLASHSHLAPQIIGLLDEECIFTTRFSLGSIKIARKHAHKLQEFLNAVDADGSNEEDPNLLAIEISIAQIGKNQVV